MTAENEGTGATSQGDDPFAYLYRQEGDDPSAPQPAASRRSFNQVHTVGERQYGGPRTEQTAYGQQQPNAHYAAPETMPGGGHAVTQHHPRVGGGRGRGGGNHNGLLILAMAVVAAVVIGIGSAIYFNDGSGDSDKAGDPSNSTAGKDGGNGNNKPGAKPRKGKPIGKKQDAASLQLAGGAALASDVPNAKSAGGQYAAGMNTGGASATWTIDKVPADGLYTLYVRYGVPGEDATSTLTVNGEPRQQPMNLKNYAQAQKGDWAKGWTQTYQWVDLKQGQNTFKISCEAGNQCNFNLDQVWLKAGKLD
jgi:hypothetical protein